MTPPRSADPRGRHLAARPGRRPGDAAFLAGCVLLLWVVIAVSTLSWIAAVGSIAAAAMLVFVLVLTPSGGGGGRGGFERAAIPVIVAALFFAPMNDLRPARALSFVTVTDALLAVGFALLAPVLLTRKLTLPKPFLLGWAVLLPTGLVASVLAEDPGVSFNHFARLLAAALVLPVAFLWWRPDHRVVGWLALAYVAGAAGNVVAAVVEGPIDTENRHNGLTTHANFLGHTSVLAVCLTLYLLSRQPLQRRWLVYGLAAVCGYGVWISGSRASLVAVVVVLALTPLVERSMFAVGGVLLGTAMTLLFWSRLVDGSGGSALRRLLGTSYSETADSYRRSSLEAALDEFLARPLTGNGFERALDAHNIYLQLAAAAGVLGLLGFLFLLWALVSPLVTVPRPDHRLAYPALAYLLIGALDKSLWDRFIWVALVLALLAPLLAEARPDRRMRSAAPAHAGPH